MNNKGFTLIEVIAVLIILAVLASVVVVKFNDFTSNAKEITEKYEAKANERISQEQTKLPPGWLKGKKEGWNDSDVPPGKGK